MTRLLYVEDNDDNVYMLKMRLELLDEFEVLVAEDGEKGCAAALEHQPDLILMDLDLPVIDGWEATRRLKNDPRTRDIPVIALSAHALAGAREKAIEAGCDEFDTKPVEFDRLLGKIRQNSWGGRARPVEMEFSSSCKRGLLPKGTHRARSNCLCIKPNGTRGSPRRTRPYSIPSSARTRNASGIVAPSALAVFRLMTRSNFVGCATGRSAGVRPLRILST